MCVLSSASSTGNTWHGNTEVVVARIGAAARCGLRVRIELLSSKALSCPIRMGQGQVGSGTDALASSMEAGQSYGMTFLGTFRPPGISRQCAGEAAAICFQLESCSN